MVLADEHRAVIGERVERQRMQCSSVDFPEPLGPITAVNSPAPRLRVTLSSATMRASPVP